jgi:hypothetical protein
MCANAEGVVDKESVSGNDREDKGKSKQKKKQKP